MRVLITGATGFIGTKLSRRLAERGIEVTGLDVVSAESESFPGRFVLGDVRNERAVREAIEGCEAVFHLAAAHHDFGIEEQTYWSVNVRGTQMLCDVMRELAVERLCFYSSVAVFGDAPEPRREDGQTSPNSHYGRSKLAAERVVRTWWAERANRRALIMRPTITFGPMNFGNMYTLIRQIYRRRYVPVGNGLNEKSLCFVENLLDATLYLWDSEEIPPFDCFNYVDKPDLSSREIADIISRALGRRALRGRVPLTLAIALAVPFDIVSRITGRDLPISTARVRKFASQRTVFGSDKLRSTGFVAKHSLPEALTAMTAWFQVEGRILQPVLRHAPRDVLESSS